MGKFVDDRYFPLVVVTFPPLADVAFVDTFIPEADGPVLRKKPHVTLIDASATRSIPDPLVRKRIGDWAKTREELVRDFVLGTAFVIASPLARGALTAVLWIAPPSYPMQVAATWRDGLGYLREQYERKLGPTDVFARYAHERKDVRTR